jgi:diaminohydroxyphosphoribosylaminopyrimidine deaminase/5-amino-6-(5-phosphoribosylamino)uracil reductase
MNQHEYYMERCLELAKRAAVMLHQIQWWVRFWCMSRIIGEGFHQKYGSQHAEVNCIQAVSKENGN